MRVALAEKVMCASLVLFLAVGLDPSFAMAEDDANGVQAQKAESGVEANVDAIETGLEAIGDSLHVEGSWDGDEDVDDDEWDDDDEGDIDDDEWDDGDDEGDYPTQPWKDGEATALALGAPACVEVSEGKTWFSFIPESNGIYYFTAGESDECDPFGELFDAGGKSLASDDNSADYDCFRMCVSLEAGRTYYLLAGYDEGRIHSGSYSLSVSEDNPYNFDALDVRAEADSVMYEEGALVYPEVVICDKDGVKQDVPYTVRVLRWDDGTEQYTEVATQEPGEYYLLEIAPKEPYFGFAKTVGEFKVDDGVEDFNDWYHFLSYEVYPSTGDPVLINDGEPFLGKDGAALVEGVDYKLVFQDDAFEDLAGAPSEPGYYWVKIVALEGGRCRGYTSYEEFKISSVGVNDLMFSSFELAADEYTVSAGEELSLEIKQMKSYVGADLALGEDCDLKFYSCDRWGDNVKGISGKPASSGYYLVQIVAKDGSDYTGSSATQKIHVAASNNLAEMDLTLSTQIYMATGNGISLQLEPIVAPDGVKLVEGRDYVLRYYCEEDDTESDFAPTKAGSYEVRAEGVGSYVGSTDSVEFEIVAASIDDANLVLTGSSFVYDGKVHKPTVKTVGGKVLKAGIDYTVNYSDANSKNAGSYTVYVTGKGCFKGNSAKATYVIAKAKNSFAAKAIAKTAKLKSVKKKSVVVSGGIKVTNKGVGAITYAKVAKGSAKQLAVNKKNGKITVKKGTKKGTYKIKVKVSAKGDANHSAASKTVTVKVKVK